MNQEELQILHPDRVERIEEKMEQVKDILFWMKKGKTVGEIVEKLNCPRSLVNYYHNLLRK